MATKNYTPEEAAGLGLGWVDANNPNYGKAGYVGSETPAAAAAPEGETPIDNGGSAQYDDPNATPPQEIDPGGAAHMDNPPVGADPFQGQGFWTGAQWVPKNHPLAQPKAGSPAPGAPNTYGPGGTGDPNAPPPTPFTSTPNMQDVQRKAIMDQIAKAQQGATLGDADIKAQLDPFAAQQERTRQTAENEAAERASAMGMGSSGALDIERRSAQERAGLNTAVQGGNLVSQKLQSQRDDLKNYLDLNAKTIDADQARMMQEKLANLDAQIKREGLAVQSNLGQGDLDLRRSLGNKGLENDIMRMLLQNKQFGNDLGFRIGSKEADVNAEALRAQFGY